MTLSMLTAAAELLRDRYGSPERPGPLHRWTTLVQVVAGPARRGRRRPDESTVPESGPLRSARETSQSLPAALAELLKSAGRPERLAAAFSSLAKWWIRDERRESESADAWSRSAESLRDELRSLPGVSAVLADRILLFVGGLPVFPIDRATIRIAGRHGWVEPSADFDEWQAFFRREADNSADLLTRLHNGFGQLGHDYCGVQPHCDDCPLRALLPVSGPAQLSDENGE